MTSSSEHIPVRYSTSPGASCGTPKCLCTADLLRSESISMSDFTVPDIVSAKLQLKVVFPSPSPPQAKHSEQ